MHTDGIWRSKHQGDIPIIQMTDEHLISAIKYLRKVIIKHYVTAKNRTGEHMNDNLLRWEDLIIEAAKRHLTWDYSMQPPNPDDFKGQTYQHRTPVQPPRGGRPRAGRSVSI